FSLILPSRAPPYFPYTTLFRSRNDRQVVAHEERVVARERRREIRERRLEVGWPQGAADERFLAGESGERVCRGTAGRLARPYLLDQPAARRTEQQLTPCHHVEQITAIPAAAVSGAQAARPRSTIAADELAQRQTVESCRARERRTAPRRGGLDGAHGSDHGHARVRAALGGSSAQVQC